MELMTDVIEEVKTTTRGLYIITAAPRIIQPHAMFHKKIQIALNTLRIIISLQTML